MSATRHRCHNGPREFQGRGLRRLATAAALAAALASTTIPTATPAAAATGSISGTVTDAIGTARGGVVVSVRPSPQHCSTAPTTPRTTSDSAGRYEIDGLNDGAYTVCFHYPGHLRPFDLGAEAYGDSQYAYETYTDTTESPTSVEGIYSNTTPTPVTVAGGASTSGIDARLAGAANIWGRITDREGNPVGGARVTVRYSASATIGMGLCCTFTKALLSTTTSESGWYAISSVRPGALSLIVEPAPESGLNDLEWPAQPPDARRYCTTSAPSDPLPTFVRDGEILHADAVVGTGRVASGVVLGLHRAPVAGQFVRIDDRAQFFAGLDSESFIFPDCPETTIGATTGYDGRWTAEVWPTWYRVRTTPPEGYALPPDDVPTTTDQDIPPTGDAGPIVTQLLPICKPTSTRRFTDVDANEPLCANVEALAREGTVSGFADGTFRPDTLLSRASLATWLWRLAGSPSLPPGAPRFRDVPAGHPAANAIGWVAAKGIFNGWADGTFRPSSSMRRSVLLTALWRAAGRPTLDPDTGGLYPPPTFADAPASGAVRDASAWGQTEGILSDHVSDWFLYDEPADRAAAAAFLTWLPVPRG